ncbi:MAG: putative aldouronate transport system substrate-binding protein [Actinomycetota bacterium]|nr:putative aldouronate transport system substrate-binding protein [Actinomycetota bacterium]
MFHRTARIAAVTAVSVLSLTLAGCGGSDGGEDGKPDLSKNRVGAMENYKAGDQFKATAPVDFSILFLEQSHYPMKKDWLLWSEITKRTNVTLKPTVVPNSDYNQKRSLLIGSGQAPMIIPKTYPGAEKAFVSSGAILPVSDYIDLMPNYKDKVAKWNLQSNVDTLMQQNGKYYLLPGLHEDVWNNYSLAIRSDILAQLKLEIPKTWDELHTVLTAMKKAYPTKYPWTERWNKPDAGGALFGLMGRAFGTNAGWTFQENVLWDDQAKKFVFAGSSDGFKQMVTYLNTMVKEGLLDPEGFTQIDDQAKQKIANSESFVISTSDQTLVNDYRVPLAKINPSATMTRIPVPIGPAGEIKDWSRLENGMMISAKAKESPNFVAMMQFIDWLWYSDAGQEFAKWGVEGVTYTKDASGKRTLAADVDYIGMNPKGTKKLQVDYGFSGGVFAYGGSTELLHSMFSADEVEFQKVMGARKALPVPPPFPLTAEEQEEIALWQTPLKDFVYQQQLMFSLGKRDISQWDAYKAELDTKGATKYIDMVNKAYETFRDSKKG